MEAKKKRRSDRKSAERAEMVKKAVAQLKTWASAKTRINMMLWDRFFVLAIAGEIHPTDKPDEFDFVGYSHTLLSPIAPGIYECSIENDNDRRTVKMKRWGGTITLTEIDSTADLLASMKVLTSRVN